MAVPGDAKNTAELTTGAEASATRPLGIAAEHLLAQNDAQNPLTDLLRLARRRIKTIAAVWLLAVMAAAAYALFAVPTYTASGVVQVSSRDALGAGNPLLELTGHGGKMEVQTEVEIMRQREFVLDVLMRLRLNVIDPDQPSRVTSDLKVAFQHQSPIDARLTTVRKSLALARIPADRFTPARIRISALSDDTIGVEFRRDDSGGQITELKVGETLSTPELELAFSAMPLAAGDSMNLLVLTEASLLRGYLGRLGVEPLGSARMPTNLVRVTLTHNDRHTATMVVQAIMEKYLRQDLEWQALRASRSAQFIREQLETISARLREQEENLQQFAEKEQAVDLTAQAQVTIETAAELEAEKAQIELQARLVGNVVGRLQRKLDTGESAHLTANFFDDELLGAAIGSLTDNEVRYEILRATLTDEHPSVRELAAQISRQRKEVAKLLRTTQRNLASRSAEIDRTLAKVSDNLASYPDKQLQLARLTRSVEVSQRLYSFLLEKLQESEIMEAATTTDKRIVDAAGVPDVPTSPRRGQIVLFGVVGGLALGLSIVYVSRYLRQRIDTIEAVREMAPYSVYATIPKIEGDDGNEISDDRVGIADVWKSPHDPAPEAFRTLRVNVSFIPTRGTRGRILQITSSQPGEGKSTVISNLAVSLTKSGARVLILDLDLRRPMQHRIWHVARAPGFSDFVAKTTMTPDPEHMRMLDDYNVELIPAGTKVPETLTSVMSPHFPTVLRKFAERYDYVLIDSPPIFVADTMVVGQYVDLILVTARPGQVTRSNLSHAVDFLSRLPNTRKGLVLNGVGSEHSEYYYGKNYYYYYGRAYGESGQDDRRAA